MMPHNRTADVKRVRESLISIGKNGCQAVLLLTVLLLAIVVVWRGSSLNHNMINSEKNSIFPEPWQYSVNGSAFLKTALPNSISARAESRISLTNHLPKEMVKGATVLLRTSQQNVDVSVNGVVIYSSLDSTGAPSSAYHFVRLPTDCATQPILVSLASPYSNYAGFMGEIYIGSKASNVFFLLHENGIRFFIGFLVFSVGFLLMIMFLFAKSHAGKASIPNLGAFFVCAGYWVMVESRMMQFIFPYPTALTNSSVFAMTLLPVFAGLYYYNTYTRSHKKIARAVIAVVCGVSLAFAVIACLIPTLPVSIFPYYLVFLVAFLVLLFFSAIYESKKAEKISSFSVWGMLIFVACALIELLLYLSNTRAYNQSNLLTIGLMMLCIFMVADSVQTFTQVYRAAVKVDTLSVLAYWDSLTGLKNRTAFLEEMSATHVDENSVTIAMYDVNNLKIVNDTKGHLVGDALLLHSAKSIKASLRQNDKVFRVGGDEFVAIIIHDDDFDCDSLETRILDTLEFENQKSLSYTLSIAYGFATYTSSMDTTLFDTQARADENMYSRKRVQKSSTAPQNEAG